MLAYDEKISDMKINIPDPELKREILKRLNAKEITAESILELKNLNLLHNINIKDLTGLEYAKELRVLNLGANPIKDLIPIANLKKLQELVVISVALDDFSVIAKLHGLKKLRLSTCKTKFFMPLENETKIPYFNIIKKLWDYKAMTKLERKKLEEFLFNPNKKTAREALAKTVKSLIFVRNVLNEKEIKEFLKTRLNDENVNLIYIDQMLKHKPFGDQTKDFILNNSDGAYIKIKKHLMKKQLRK